MRSNKTLIRLLRCAGWSESSLVACLIVGFAVRWFNYITLNLPTCSLYIVHLLYTDTRYYGKIRYDGNLACTKPSKATINKKSCTDIVLNVSLKRLQLIRKKKKKNTNIVSITSENIMFCTFVRSKYSNLLMWRYKKIYTHGKKLSITHSLTKHFYFDLINNPAKKQNRNIIESVYKRVH